MKQLFENIKPLYRFTPTKQLRYLLLFCMQVFSCVLFAQKKDIKFEYLGIQAGLSHSDVYCVLQDSRGFMWFGTSNGLNKYDGYQFTVYKNTPSDQYSLNNNSILKIIEDSQGIIWLATWGGGLNKFDREKKRFTHFTHDPLNENSISSDFVTSLLEDKQGNLWIGTQNGALELFDRRNNRFVHYSRGTENKTLGNVFISTIFEDNLNNLWIGTMNEGLNLLDRNSKTFSKYKYNEKDSKSLCNNDVNVVFEDSRKNLWIGTNGGGLDQLNRKKGEFSHFKNNLRAGSIFPDCDIKSIIEDDNGNLYIGSRNGGLSIFNPATGISQNYLHDELDITSLSRNSITSIYKDLKGNIWIGTMGGGINFLNKAGKEFTHYMHNSSKSSLSDNNVTSIYEDSDKNLWIGTDGGGLNFFDREAGSFIHYTHQANNKTSICGDIVLSICEDSKGNLWIGTWAEGITVFNKMKNTFKHFKNDPAKPSSLGSNNVWAIFEDKEKNIWVGTYGGGLNLYNPGNDSFTHYKYDEKNPAGINNNNIITIFEDSKGFLWIGTEGGLSQFDKKTKKFVHFTHDDSRNSLSYNFVSDIFEDRNGNLYIASGTGLNYFNTGTHHFTVYSAKDGFTDDAVSGILQDAKGDLWISTGKGISRFDPATKKFINFNTEDGLYANNYRGHAYCKSSAGVMYFGGTNGFDSFFPDSVNKISFDPPLVITDFQVFNKEIPIAIDDKDPSPLKKDITETKKITIPYSSSVISFEFASLPYGVRERKQYAYMLEGFDKTWNKVGTQRTATYTNRDPGEYVFKVKGLNNEETWSLHITSLQLTITPPFWMTWWFKLGVLVSIAGAALGFYKFRFKIIEAQKRKLQYKVNEQTLQLQQSTEEEHRARGEAEQANIELERKNKELEQFAYVASHDMQEPLRTTSSFVELLQKQYKGKLDEKADKYLSFIAQSSDRMKVLIKDLLDYSRIGREKELKEVDCNIMLNEVLADLGTAINETGAEIKREQLPVVNGYPTEIKQLFQNLIINAIKFREKTIPPQINISVQKISGYWQFAFKDNGIGIAKENNERIFIIFQRLHTRNEYSGSGIGLSHSKKIVELHKGKIWMESELGKGTTFYFTLPTLQVGIPQRNNN